MFFGGKKGKIWPPGQIDPKGTHPPPKHVFGCTERKSTLLRVSCGRIEGTKKIKKARDGTISPICPPHPPFSAATIFCMCCRTVDIITHARFQVNRFRGFGAQGGRNDHPPLTWHIAVTTVYALTCYTVITCSIKYNFTYGKFSLASLFSAEFHPNI